MIRTILKTGGILLVFTIIFLSIIWLPTKPSAALLEKMTHHKLLFSDQLNQAEYCILIDYNKAVFKKRLWVIDLQSNEIVIHSHVSHAGKSGLIWPSVFSNKPQSNLSSIGTFKTGNAYESTHGKGEYKIGMRIIGLEPGLNDNVLARNIVFHSSSGFWSAGCFMTQPRMNKAIIDLTKNGNMLYVAFSK